MTDFPSDLRESNAFLNLLLDSIDTAVLVVDENLVIHQINTSFRRLYHVEGQAAVEKSFGRISGCVNSVRENKPCGATSQCGGCSLRQAIHQTMAKHLPVERLWLERIFFIDGGAVAKYLEFSTRPLRFKDRAMTLVTIHDVTQLERQRIELERKQAKLDEDLKIAAAIQKSMLPEAAIANDFFETCWRYEACEQVGGDIFNVNCISGDQVSFYMVDACGHGPSAALVSVAVSQYLQSHHGMPVCPQRAESPAEMLNRLQHVFTPERLDGGFFSIGYLSLNLLDQRLTYVNAGLPPPVVIHADGGLDILDHRHPAVGLNTDVPYTDRSIPLRVGDKILLYTDGLLENRNPAEKMFGKNRMYAVLQGLGDLGVEAVVNGLWAENKRFRGLAQSDDDTSLLGIGLRRL